MLAYWDGYFVYNFLGSVLSTPNYGGGIAAFVDFDFDKINEIIGYQRCPPELCGVTVRKYNGEKLNGFPNPPQTGFISTVVDDIDRDGNYEIIFAPDEDINPYMLGLYVIGSWGGILPGFPVDFPLANPNPPGIPAQNYSSPTVGDFNDDGILEIAVGTGNRKLYLIRSDGSHYRNWPVMFFMGSWIEITPPALGDIDNDGRLEIATNDSSDLNKLFAFNEDASLLEGFPIDIGDGPLYYSPALADVNEDGNLELYALVLCNGLYAFDNK